MTYEQIKHLKHVALAFLHMNDIAIFVMSSKANVLSMWCYSKQVMTFMPQEGANARKNILILYQFSGNKLILSISCGAKQSIFLCCNELLLCKKNA